jgi:hypothetical protein
MPPPLLAQVAMPVRRIEPVTTRGGRAFGFLARSRDCIVSNVAASMIGSTETAI